MISNSAMGDLIVKLDDTIEKYDTNNKLKSEINKTINNNNLFKLMKTKSIKNLSNFRSDNISNNDFSDLINNNNNKNDDRYINIISNKNKSKEDLIPSNKGLLIFAATTIVLEIKELWMQQIRSSH